MFASEHEILYKIFKLNLFILLIKTISPSNISNPIFVFLASWSVLGLFFQKNFLTPELSVDYWIGEFRSFLLFHSLFLYKYCLSPIIYFFEKFNGLTYFSHIWTFSGFILIFWVWLIHIICHYNPSVRIMNASCTTYNVCVNFRHESRDLQFKVDSERQIFEKPIMAFYKLSEFLPGICWKDVAA